MKCSVTNKDYDQRHLTRTTDGHALNWKLYLDLSFEMGQGRFSLQEAKEAHSFLKRHFDAVTDYIYAVRVYAKANEISDDESYKEFLGVEQDVAELRFNTDASALNKEQHVEVMAEVKDVLYAGLEHIDMGRHGGEVSRRLRAEYWRYHGFPEDSFVTPE